MYHSANQWYVETFLYIKCSISCCDNALLRPWLGFGTKNTYLGSGENLVLATQTGVDGPWSPLKHAWKLSWGLMNTIQWFQPYKCWNVALNWRSLALHPSCPLTPPPSLPISGSQVANAVCSVMCTNVNISVVCRKMLTAHILSWQLS